MSFSVLFKSTFLLLAMFVFSIAGEELCEKLDFALLETMPSNLNLSGKSLPDHYSVWTKAFKASKSSINVAALWLDLAAGGSQHTDVGGWRAVALEREFLNAAHRGVKATVVTNDCRTEGFSFACNTTENWIKAGEPVKVVYGNWSLIDGDHPRGWSVTHSKLVTIDGVHSYLGSANFAWTSLCQTRELGIQISNCQPLTHEIEKLISAYALASVDNKWPTEWPEALRAVYTRERPAQFPSFSVFLSAAPPQISRGLGFTDDLDQILYNIDHAHQCIDISLMDYAAQTLYQNRALKGKEQYFDDIDNVLRRASFRGVKIRLIVSNWTRTMDAEVPYWYSLNALENVSVRKFEMPAWLPYYDKNTRVNHAKFMLCDSVERNVLYRLLMGTSNWPGDYFSLFTGASWNFATSDPNFQTYVHLREVFERDWSSGYAIDL